MTVIKSTKHLLPPSIVNRSLEVDRLDQLYSEQGRNSSHKRSPFLGPYIYSQLQVLSNLQPKMLIIPSLMTPVSIASHHVIPISVFPRHLLMQGHFFWFGRKYLYIISKMLLLHSALSYARKKDVKSLRLLLTSILEIGKNNDKFTNSQHIKLLTSNVKKLHIYLSLFINRIFI